MTTTSYVVQDRAAIITIERPDRRNAVDLLTAHALFETFQRFDTDESVDVAILQGRGGNFCAGADLKAFADGESGPRLTRDGVFGPMGPTRMQLSKPVIAAVEGYAVAGGFELALWADLRVMAEGAVFGVFCRRFGVPLIDLGTVRLPRLIGQSRAMDLILTGREVGVDEAFSIGLANRRVPQGDALAASLALAAQLSTFPQTCMRNDRTSALDQWSLDWDAAIAREADLGFASLATGDSRAGARRFSHGAGRHGTQAPIKI